MKRRIVIISALLWLWLAAPAAAIEVNARVDHTHLGPGETLHLMVTIINGEGQVDVRNISDFKVIPRGTSTNLQIINGRTTREVMHNYLLIPKTKGKLTIPALPVYSDGATYHTQPIVIAVSNQPAAGSTDTSRDVFVDTALSDNSPYAGQQIIYTFRVHNAVNIANARFQPPGFSGFSAKEIESKRNTRKIINGREFSVIEIYYVLVPLAPGPLTIEPALLQADVQVAGRRRQRSPYDPFFNRGVTETRAFQTDPIQVTVRPLPAPSGETTFSGLVGHFELSARLDKSDLKVGDSATLAVTIRGRGNIMDARPPGLNLPTSFKTYDDNPEEKIKLDRNGYYGLKIFRTALVPVQDGNVALPPVQLAYFDVEQSSYRTLTAAIPAINIKESGNPQTMPITITPEPLGPLKRQVAFTGRDILPPKEGLTAIAHQAPLSGGLFIIGLVAPMMLFGAALVVQRLQRRDLTPAAVMKTKSRQALKAAHTEEESAFLTHLYQALTAAIHAAAGRTGEALTWQEAQATLEQNGWAEEEARQAAQLLTTIESNKFSGARLDAQQRSDLLKQVKKMTRKLAP